MAVPSGSELPSSLMLIQYQVHNTSPNKSTAVIVNDHNADGTTCAERPRHSPMTGLCDDLAILTTARVRLLVDSFVERANFMTCHGGRLVLCCCWNRSPTKKLEMRRLYLVSAGRNLYVRTLCARYVCTWYQPATQIRSTSKYMIPGT